MTSVWIVEQGEYSDYGVVAVCSTKENAEYLAAWINSGERARRYDQATIAERPLDPHIDGLRAGLQLFFVRLRLDNGDVVEARPDTSTYSMDDSEVAPDASGGVYTHVWAKDPAGAVKIAGERRARFKANLPPEHLQGMVK